MEDVILISYLNDFIFCPVSIYFHKLYGNIDRKLYQTTSQVEGIISHEKIDLQKYSTKTNILQSIDVYSSKYGILGKIDVFEIDIGILTERKKKVNKVYDGFIYQLYAQYYALTEMGYNVKKLKIHSMDDNKNYFVDLPQDNQIMQSKFENLIKNIKAFNIANYEQTNSEKCKKCIYEPSCDRSKNVNRT